MKKTVALIMPALNEERNVAVTFDAIFASSRLPDEIVVADAFSTDDTKARILAYADRGIPLKIVDNPGILPGAGRNAAVAVSTSDIVMLLDFGNKPDPKWIAELARPFEEDPDTGISAGTYAPFADADFEHCIAAIHYHRNYVQHRLSSEERFAMRPPRTTPGGLSVAYDRTLWVKAGGQPEWLRTAEDTLFSRKLVAMGAKVAEQPDAWSFHHMRSSPAAFFKQIYLYARGHGRTRCVSQHFPKLLIVYGAFLGLGVLSFATPLAGLAAVAALLLYYLYSGPRKLIETDGRLKKVKYLWLPALVVFPRDIATLAGHAVGWGEWFFKPRYRELFNSYVEGSNRSDYAFIPNR